MKSNKFFSSSVSALALILTQNLAFANAVNVHEYSRSANPAYVFSEDSLSDTGWSARGNGRLFFGADYDMINDPLVELDSNHDKRTKTLIESMHSLNLSAAYSFASRLQVGLSTSASLVRLDTQRTEFGLGDTRAFTKVRLTNDHAPVGFALMPELYIPTGSRRLFLSDDSVGAGIKAILERDFGPLVVTGNAGFRYSPKATYRDLNKKAGVPLSLAVLIPIGPRWAINTEASSEISVPFNSHQNPSQFYAGARYRLPSDFIVHLGGAVGALNTHSSADFRIIAGLTLMPQPKAEPIVEQKPAPAPVVAAAPVPAPQPVAPAPKARVVFTPKEIVISEEVKFEHNKARLTTSGQELLDEVAKVMKDNDKHFKAIIIEGHTNEIGSFKHNQKLSEQRAASVKEYLVGRGVKRAKLRTVGYGKTRPKVTEKDGLSKEARLAANRRVEFKVVSPSGKINAAAPANKLAGILHDQPEKKTVKKTTKTTKKKAVAKKDKNQKAAKEASN